MSTQPMTEGELERQLERLWDLARIAESKAEAMDDAEEPRPRTPAYITATNAKYAESVALRAEYNKLLTKAVTESVMLECGKDTKRLDWLESKGAGWVCRISTIGRGWRLHQDDPIKGLSDDVRTAIDTAMEWSNG